MPITQKEEEEQASIIQRELAKALSPSVQGVTDEPLPRRMVILLLRLVWAQTLRAMQAEDVDAAKARVQIAAVMLRHKNQLDAFSIAALI